MINNNNEYIDINLKDNKDSIKYHKSYLEFSVPKYMALNSNFTFAINDYNNLFCWGLNKNNILNISNEYISDNINTNTSDEMNKNINKNSNNIINIPYEHTDLNIKSSLFNNIYFTNKLKIIEIACGLDHVACIADSTTFSKCEGNLYTWGNNIYGRLGHDCSLITSTTSNNYSSICQVKIPENIKVSRVSCGYDYTACITSNGKLYTWGSNKYGNLGINMEEYYNENKNRIMDISNKVVSNLSNLNYLKEHEFTNMQYLKDIDIYNNLCVNLPTQVKGLKNFHVFQISCGSNHMLALINSNNIISDCTINNNNNNNNNNHNTYMQVYSWGHGKFGVLGHDNTVGYNRPTLINKLSNQNIVYINAGDYNSAAISKEGKLFIWGRGKYGLIGNGELTDKLCPERVVSNNLDKMKVNNISIGLYHCLCTTCKN